MSNSATAADTKVLYSHDGQTWNDGSGLAWSPDEAVVKIVIGRPLLHREDDEQGSLVELKTSIPDDLSTRYPQLTHLHLWQISNLCSLPPLPPGLQCLDIRGCAHLQTLPDLPSTLDTLVLDQCPALVLEPGSHNTHFPVLTDFSLRGGTSIGLGWIQKMLPQATALRKLDLTACTQLEQLRRWPDSLVDLTLDNCRGLNLLLGWPPKLRRISLRHAETISTLSPLPESTDYVDVAYTRSLQALPIGFDKARTLCLYGSGILEPPASEHGTDDQQNVAEDVRSYFEDVALTGQGTIRRCKLLILGNGQAGKTCLSLNITDRDPALAAALGSTHGVQFWDWNFQANVDSQLQDVHLHVWDFGGQDIYHNTHRLFMSIGTVFVVVWNPAQDGQQPPRDSGLYHDAWRPLEYWLDLIRLSCDHHPKIAVVCSNHDQSTEALQQRWQQALRENFDSDSRLFFIDSLQQTGDRQELTDWLQDEVGQVIQTQGTAVPMYWELAQEMVEEWVGKLATDATFAATHNSLPTAEFAQQLQQYVDHRLQQDPDPRYEQLRQAINGQQFELTEDRIRRTLNFLTRSGWVYWNPQLFESRVIIGQQWALDGLYTILERPGLTKETRRPSPEIFRNLRLANGRFTRSDLGQWVWDDVPYSPDEQLLLISFMNQCGLCFRLRSAEHAWREEDIYISIEHLPAAKELCLQDELSGMDVCTEKLDVPFLHKFDWHGYLADAGRKYGTDATYAADAVYLQTEDRQHILISCFIRPAGVGGVIRIETAGPKAEELLSELLTEFRTRFPSVHRPGQERSMLPEVPAKARVRREVFVSYSWNSASEPDIDYEAPVEAIERFFRKQNFEIRRSHPDDRNDSADWELVRDKEAMKQGDDITEFMKNGAKMPHVILVHSDRYWKSPNCMFELFWLNEELRDNEDKGFQKVVILVEHPSSRITDAAGVEEYKTWWENYTGPLPARLRWRLDELKAHATSQILSYGPRISGMVDSNLRWKDGESVVLEGVRQRLALQAAENHEDDTESDAPAAPD